MKRLSKSTFKYMSSMDIALWVFTFLAITFYSLTPVYATNIPASPNISLAGHYDFVITGGTLRTSASNQCAVTNSGSATLSGIPNNPGTSIRAAFLYWAGSGSAYDWVVTLNGSLVNAAAPAPPPVPMTDPPRWPGRTFIEAPASTAPMEWFGGFADVTNIVKSAGGNGNYTFANLSVDTGDPYCFPNTNVLSGWGLVVIYEDPVEPLRVINLYDGLQIFWGSSISLTPDNFEVPSTIDGKYGVLTWEGDSGNSWSRGGFSEELRFNGTTLTNPPINPAANQYNSTISDQTLGMGVNNVYGVDLDVYDITAYLSQGDTSADLFYSTGQDRVLLGLEIISATNIEVADLSISKSHAGTFLVGQQGTYTIRVTNNGPSDDPGPITVEDTLPTGLTYVSGSGTNWSCVAGAPVECTYTGTAASGTSIEDLTLTVDVGTSAVGTVTNSVSVEGALFDNVDSNDEDDDDTIVVDPSAASGTKQLYFYMDEAPLADRNTLQRVVVSSPTRSNLIAPGSSITYDLLPETQTPLTLQAGNIPINIWLRRRTDPGSRNVTVRLHYSGGSSGTIGSQTLTGILSASPWTLTPFTINLGGDLTLDRLTTLHLTLTNEASSSGNIRARSIRGGTLSQIALNAATVINVDSVEAWSDDGSEIQSSYGRNSTTLIRAVVSDPFGHEDINSAYITIIDPNNNPEVNNAAMTQIDPVEPPAQAPQGTKTYEYTFNIPDGPDGTWTAQVTANEGTEGTIAHTGIGTFLVGMPNIVVSKTVSTISNPVEGSTNAHSIPGATVQYDLVVTNTGLGPADRDSVIINDLLPTELRLILNDPIAPAVFIDGNTYGQSASGLTFDPDDVGNNTGPFDDVALSNDGGGTFLVIGSGPGDIQQTGGLDSTDPKLDFIRLNPKGVFAGSTGGAAPSFTIRFQLRIE